MPTIDESKNVIEVKNVSFSYGEQEVLKDVSLNIHKGDYLGLVGPNGGGKTTLLKIVLGLLQPDKGHVEIFGENINSFKQWHRIGYVPQHAIRFDFSFPATVTDIVSMGFFGKKGLFRSLDKHDGRIVSEVIESVEMQNFRNTLIGDLSGGQQQRVFIARALVSNPEIMLLDEPTTGIDVESQENFYDLLEHLNEKYDLTLVLISHDVDVIAKEVNHLASINQKLTYFGSPSEFMKADHLGKLYSKNLGFIHHHKH